MRVCGPGTCTLLWADNGEQQQQDRKFNVNELLLFMLQIQIHQQQQQPNGTTSMRLIRPETVEKLKWP